MSNGGATDLSQGLIEQSSQQGPQSPKPDSSQGPRTLEGVFTLRGVHVKLTLDDDLLSWKPVGKTRACMKHCGVREGEGACRWRAGR